MQGMTMFHEICEALAWCDSRNLGQRKLVRIIQHGSIGWQWGNGFICTQTQFTHIINTCSMRFTHDLGICDFKILFLNNFKMLFWWIWYYACNKENLSSVNINEFTHDDINIKTIMILLVSKFVFIKE